VTIVGRNRMGCVCPIAHAVLHVAFACRLRRDRLRRQEIG